jgi:nucleoside-diphosphate-sugar epimerase
MRALVIGGTGPTGHFIVGGLRRRGYEVTILHTGRHEIPEIPSDVLHLHTDPYSEPALLDALEGRRFDLCIAAYGRLRSIARVMVGRTERFVSIGGAPAYRGYMNPTLFRPAGLPVPVDEDAPLVEDEADDAKGWRIVRTEGAVFEQHPRATHFRYPYVYGPYQPMPREWCIVRRILDRRPHIILPDDGLTLAAFGYAENLAGAVLLAVDRPAESAGRIYHCADEEVLTLRQVVEIIAAALEHELEIVSMPASLAVPTGRTGAPPPGPAFDHPSRLRSRPHPPRARLSRRRAGARGTGAYGALARRASAEAGGCGGDGAPGSLRLRSRGSADRELEARPGRNGRGPLRERAGLYALVQRARRSTERARLRLSAPPGPQPPGVTAAGSGLRRATRKSE